MEIYVQGKYISTYEPNKINSVKNCRPLVSVIDEEDCPLLVSETFSRLDQQGQELLDSELLMKNEDGSLAA